MGKYDSKEDTIKHIKLVFEYSRRIRKDLFFRELGHDKSKLEEPEKSVFDEFTPKLATSTYGSEEYKGFLKEMNVALEHHYSVNRHHPEHFENGIKGMTLVDLIEMICDWKAATLRHHDGNILKSIELNQERFGYSDELKQIIINTVNYYFVEEEQKWDED